MLVEMNGDKSTTSPLWKGNSSTDPSKNEPLLTEQDKEMQSEASDGSGTPVEGRRRVSEPAQYLISITLGIAFGMMLNVLGADDDTITIATIPGALFLRALQCAVIPMMFFNITASVADIFGSGNAGTVGSKAIQLYMLTTLVAVTEGIILANVFSSLFDTDKGFSDDDDGAEINLKCPKDLGMMTVDKNGDLQCIHHDELSNYNTSSKYQRFFLQDEDSMLINGVLIKQSLVDQIMNTAHSIVPNNVAESFATPNIVSVIMIAFMFGAAIVKMRRETSGPLNGDTVLAFSKEMATLTNIIISWIIVLAPFCIGFLIANSLASAGNLLDLLRTVGVYVASVLTGLLIHTTIALPAIFYYNTGENPYQWLYLMRRPFIVAFSTESSAATLPVSILTAVNSGRVDESTANTILPMGATINMDGSAIGYPCAITFLAHTAQLQRKLNIATWINVGLGSTLGSAGAAPVPNAGVVMLITVWETAFPGYAVPDAISYVQAIEFFVARFQTATNVISDLFIVRMIQASIDREKKHAQ